MDLTGTYDASTPAGVVTVTLQASPDGRLQGEVRTGPIVLHLVGSTDGVRGEGTATSELGASAVFQLEGSGDQLAIQLVDLATGGVDAVVCQRRRDGAPRTAMPAAPALSPRGPAVTSPARAAPAPMAAPGALVGTWQGPHGRTRFDADGSVVLQGQRLQWAVDGDALVLTGPGGSARVAYLLDGDRLQFTSSGQTESLARIDPDDPMQAAAGVWVATESHVDPAIAMVITQYVTLYPDGGASFQKTEGGASRTQVSESMERFSSFRHTGQRSVNGRWRSDGRHIEVQWGWRNAPVVGRVDVAAGKLVLADVGILVEGATLTYDRQ
jgi:hypothetical protein